MATIKARGYFDVVGLDQGGLECKDESLTVQASKDECDINTIINKYLRTGELPQRRQEAYGDLSQLPDLQEAMNQVALAQEAFMALPADVRGYFDNDPVKLVEFAQDPANTEKAIALGLATARPPSAAASDPAPAGQAGGAGTEPARPAPPKGGA